MKTAPIVAPPRFSAMESVRNARRFQLGASLEYCTTQLELPPRLIAWRATARRRIISPGALTTWRYLRKNMFNLTGTHAELIKQMRAQGSTKLRRTRQFQ
jgi:hypothetical protein